MTWLDYAFNEICHYSYTELEREYIALIEESAFTGDEEC